LICSLIIGVDMKKYEAVIFDMDGTILNTIDDLTNSMNEALCNNGFNPRTIEEIKSFIGNGIFRLTSLSVPENTSEEKLNEVFRDFKVIYANHSADLTRPYDGIIETIKKIRVLGYKTAVVSNKYNAVVIELCDKYFKGLFDTMVGEQENIKRKPNPDEINMALKTLGINRDKAIYIGDSEVDKETAKNSKLDFIAVSWGYRTKEFLKSLEIQNIADTPDDILKYL